MAWIGTSLLERVSPRERLILMGGAGVLLLMGLWALFETAGWYSDRMQSMDRLIQEKQKDRIALVGLQKEYLALRGRLSGLEDRIARDRGSFSLLSFLESLAGKLGMRSNIAYMRPQPPTDVEGFRELGVEVKVQNVTLEQTVRLLSSIEDSPHLIRVKQLQIRTRFSDPRFLDATFLTVTYEEL
jgi:general secretion pathway protein M